MTRYVVRLAAVGALMALVSAAPAAAASIWTPVNSGTTQTISAIAYPNASTVVFATTGGQIRYLSGSTFAAATFTPANSNPFTDIAMSPDGTKGVAVGPNAVIYNSTDSGHTWNLVSPPSDFSGSCPSPGGATTLTDDLFSVQFADASTVYVTGGNGAVLRSTNFGGSFTEINKSPAHCQADPGGTGVGFTDTQWIDANHGFLVSNDFGHFFSTADGLATPASARADAVNGFVGNDPLAIDPADPSRLWVTNPGNMNASYFQYTSDSGSSWNSPTYDHNQTAFQDISAGASGGSLGVVAVGFGGDIYTSNDGRNFFRQVADPPNNTTDFRAVAMFGPNSAFVGGAGGVLLATAAANTVPDTTAPTGTISGPTRLATGQFGNYTVAATDNPGGSGVDPSSYLWSTPGLPSQGGHPTASFAFSTPGVHTITVTFKDLAGNPGSATINVDVTAATVPPGGTGGTTTGTGGATIVIFKVVTVTGRKGRFIPVPVTTKKAPRKFVVKLLPAKGKKALASLTKTVAKHKHKVLHLNLPASVKPGHYRLVVRVFTTGRHSHPVGRTVKQVFLLI